MYSQPYHLVVVGFDEIVGNKYRECIEFARSTGALVSYSIVDLESARTDLQSRLSYVDFKPTHVHYLSDAAYHDPNSGLPEFHAFVSELRREHPQLRCYIATEVKAHEPYLEYCISNQISSLVEKPVVAPVRSGRFVPGAIGAVMDALVSLASKTATSHSVMTLSRYHDVYNRRFISPLQRRMAAWKAPVTSLHLRAAGGVWNRHVEYEDREDHPYKYGYGMMMHGAYHYVDLASQILSLNEEFIGNCGASLTISSYGAFPRDQHLRIPAGYAKKFDDYKPSWALTGENCTRFGETDVVSAFCLRDEESGRVITLGSLSFEQTTPSIRHWVDIPVGLYNKNGRVSLVDVEAQLSTLHSANVRVYDVPRESGSPEVDRIDAFARIETRTNASLLQHERYNACETHEGLFHSDSNKALMRAWLSGTETLSTLASHRLPMRIVQTICESLDQPGEPRTVKLW